jgi:hypothetical protein
MNEGCTVCTGHPPLSPCRRNRTHAYSRQPFRAFPPRLPEQPIFYQVLEESYAIQIARDWNTRDGGTGSVLRFQVETEYLAQFPVQTAGSRVHREYWIPAEELEEFNRRIVGLIEVIHEFRGS